MIELQGVSKTYRGWGRRKPVHALAGLTLSVGRGEVFGIAGPNGAGKSTMLSILLGYLRPTAGTALIDGHSPRRYAESSGISYLTELVSIPPSWRVQSALERFATLEGLAGPERRTRVAEAIDSLGLEEHARKQVRHLSKGNLQRLGVAQALLGERDLLVLDEPTHGLDPVWMLRFRDLIARLRRPNRTILIASHNLDELERITDRVAILSRGTLQRVVTSGGGEAGGAYRLVLAADHPAVAVAFPTAVPVEGRARAYRVEGDLAVLNHALERLLASGAQVAAFYPERSGLEAEFHSAVTRETTG